MNQTQKPERRLAAIFAADVAGYSRLVSEDEPRTLRTLTAHREIMDGLIAQHGGRIANTAGDSVLAEFPSVVDAVECAAQVQERLAEANVGISAGKALSFRIGVHVGDVVVRGTDLLGDGVNIAARVQALADPGGVWISEEAYRHVAGRVEHHFEDRGEQQLKNIARPVRLYGLAGSPSIRADDDKPPALPDKPSIAVLPFTNMSGDPEQEYFADGIVEDIITALSHLPRLLVIARNSSFTYKGRSVDVRKVGRELGVRYVLEGSVRRAGERLRLTGQLIDASDGTHLWAERFDGHVEDVFDLQDEMAAKVLGAIIPRLQSAEIERSKRTRPGSLDAYDLYLRALAAVREMTRDASNEALELVDQALRIDPTYAVAAGLGAWARTLRLAQQWPVDRDAETARGLELGRIAVSKGQEDAEALAAGGYALAFLGGELGDGLAAITRAIELNSNSALAWAHAGWVRNYLGEPDEALEALERSMRLSPRDPTLFRTQAALACAHLMRGDFEHAMTLARRAIEGNPNYTVSYRMLAAAQAHAGRIQDAQATIDRLVALVPNVSLRALAEMRIFAQSGRLEMIIDGLRKAGVPE